MKFERYEITNFQWAAYKLGAYEICDSFRRLSEIHKRDNLENHATFFIEFSIFIRSKAKRSFSLGYGNPYQKMVKKGKIKGINQKWIQIK